MKHPSLADIPERELVEQLMQNILYRNNLVGIHGIPPNVLHKTNLLMDDLPKSKKGKSPEGDIDILLIPEESPENSIAIQVKVIKVGCTAFDSKGKPNRLNKLDKGVRQSNFLAEIGFSQIYYFIIILVDSRHRNNQKYNTFDGLTPNLNTLIDQQISSRTKKLDSRIGLMRFDLVQPMDYAPLGTGAYHGHLVRSAKLIAQSSEVTEWVKRKWDQ
jgi:hypothetical protein